MRHFSGRTRGDQIISLLLGFFAASAILILGVLLALPLSWKEQGIFAGVLIVCAMLLNQTSQSRVVTITLITVSVFSTLRYGYWRTTQTWDGITSAGHFHRWDTVFVFLLLLAEYYAFATLVLGYFQTLRPLRRPPVPVAGDPAHLPTVDVFIPTYNEPLSVVRATVLGALALDYPNNKFKVFVLDDGHRHEFAEFASQVNASYITRDNNAHAKAGNINHALSRTHGEYIAIFDSDHIPTRSFLRVSLGWLTRDSRLGMVQTPHHFYSPDPFERNLGQFRRIPNEGELFHRLVQDGNDLWNASFFCGSCAVLRRQALREIGGIAVETVTEDAHTALRMQRRGWSTAYLNLPQAAGLATENLAAHIGQRVRWARGMVQILRTENPLFVRGLSVPQRLCYFNATTHFLFALPRLIFLVMPLVYLLLGMVNIYGYSLAVFAYALPHIVLSNVTNSRIQGRYRFSFWNEIYEAVLAPYILLPTLLALINPRLGKFNVTNKGGIVRWSYFDRRIALPFLLLLGLNIAGLVMAQRRLAADPLHRDTVLMNTVWTVYNIVILSVAASVAWERQQRRSQVRVNVRLPLSLVTPDGQGMAGATTQLSTSGAMVRLLRAERLARDTSVLMELEGDPVPCRIPARVVHVSKRHCHLRFANLSLPQERYLVNQIYTRPETWLSWHRSRPPDRFLRSLAQVVWLALRGIVVLFFGFFTSRPSGDRGAREMPGKSRTRAVAACFLATALMLLFAAHSHAADADQTDSSSLRSSGAAVSSSAFHDQYELSSLAGRKAITLSGNGSSQNFFWDMPLTKIISVATLELHYNAPLLSAGEGWLELSLNGTRAGSVPLVQGQQQVEVPLPADLLGTNNTLTFQLRGNCVACKRARAPWITIDPMSELNLSGTRLPLANVLALLPVPFFDSAGQHSWSLPVVFSDRPNMEALQAAAAVTSWFGVFSDFRGVRFPVTIGELPNGNALVFVMRGSSLDGQLALPTKPGALIAIRDNPRDPYGKLLIVAGNRSEDLITAAQALVTRNNAQAHADAVYVNKSRIPARAQYDAPRWLDASKPSPIGTYTTAERLKVKGSGSINIYFRLPPDLFLGSRDSVPLLLKYSYAGVKEGSPAALHIRLNERDVDTITLKPTQSSRSEQVIVRLPTGRLRPYTNTLTVDVDFGRSDPQDTLQEAAIRRDSTIDLSRLPHSVVLPRLELFANSGYPFTAWPDLARTAVIVPDAPTLADYEALFGMVGFFGAQTGAPATAITITNASHLEAVRDKDLVLLGSSPSQPLLAEWASSMPVDLTGVLQLNHQPEPTWLLHPEWPFRQSDHEKLVRLVASHPPLDLVVEGFVSPLQRDRSVVAISPHGQHSADVIAAMFTPNLDKGPIYGGLAIAQDGRFRSFLVGNYAYHSGHLDPVQRTKVFLLEHYLFIPLFVLCLAFLVAGWLYRSTERIATRRLAAGSGQTEVSL